MWTKSHALCIEKIRYRYRIDLISRQAVLEQAAGVAAAAGGESHALSIEKMLT